MACLRGGRKNMKLRQKTIKYLQYREKRHTFASLFSKHSGCSAVRLAHLLWEQGVASSNPATPTSQAEYSRVRLCSALLFPAFYHGWEIGEAGKRAVKFVSVRWMRSNVW